VEKREADEVEVKLILKTEGLCVFACACTTLLTASTTVLLCPDRVWMAHGGLIDLTSYSMHFSGCDRRHH